MAAKQQNEALEIDNWEEIEETDVRIIFYSPPYVAL